MKLKIFAFIVLGFLIFSPIIIAIYEYHEKYKGKTKEFIKYLLEGLICNLAMWIGIVILIALFILFYMIFRSYAIASILTVVVGLMLVKLIDR